MNLYVSREGQTFGPYTIEQAREYLEQGQLLSTDYAMAQGDSEWKTLNLGSDASVPPLNLKRRFLKENNHLRKVPLKMAR